MLKISVVVFGFMQEIIGIAANKVNSFLRQESGATAVEYSLIVALIGIVIVAGASALGTGINDLFTKSKCVITATTATARAAC